MPLLIKRSGCHGPDASGDLVCADGSHSWLNAIPVDGSLTWMERLYGKRTVTR